MSAYNEGKRAKNRDNGGSSCRLLLAILAVLLIAAALLTVSCRAAGPGEKETPPAETPANGDVTEDPQYRAGKENGEENGEKGHEDEGILSEELLELRPNELGQIMVLMYHEIGYPESEWRRTPENFRRDLETLYELGYRAVSLTDMVRGNIDIPAGTTPVVLTFDDGNRGNFNYIEAGGELKIDPDCAVAIMEDFYREHPDFGLEGTFFIYYPNPFRQPEYIEKKLRYLVERGFEIGNHTYGHANLSRLNDKEVMRELAMHLQKTREYLPGYEINSLSLPYGAYPQNEQLAVEGSYGETRYSHESVLLVGANPSPSPFHRNFNPYRLPRIRASEMKTEGVGLYDWLEYFEANPEKRYISDGNPALRSN